ncbi:MAG: AAA family ATPase [Candidatus Babeliales bacterium]
MFKKLIISIFLLAEFCAFGKGVLTKGSVILLSGASSSGKSVLAKKLQKQLAGGYKIISIDDFVYPAVFQAAQDLGFVSTSTMSQQQIHKNISENIGSILEVFDNAQWHGANWESIKTNMYQDVKQRIQRGENIILDTVLDASEFTATSSFTKIMSGFSICSVLVYCSPTVLLQHVLQRNAGADHKQRRDIARVMKSFCGMYEPVASANDCQRIVGYITKKEVSTIVSRVMNETDELETSRHSLAATLHNLLHETFLQVSGNGSDFAHITSRCSYDVCVDTGTMSQHECATCIKNYLAKFI